MSTPEPMQDRLPPLQADAWSEEQKAAAREFQSGRGYAVSGPFAVMLRSPEVMLRAKAMGDYLRFRNVLPKRVSEMIILVTARTWTQPYEWAYHYPIAIEAGLRPETAAAIAEGRRPDGMADDEAVAYDFSHELHTNRQVSDGTYAKALGLFGERGVIDLVGINGYYSFLAMMMNVARTPAPEAKAPALKPFPG